MLAGGEGRPGCADERLRREGQRLIVSQPAGHAAVGQRVQKQIHIRRSTAGDCAARVDLPLRHPHQQPCRLQQPFQLTKLVLRDLRSRREQDHARAAGDRQVRHDPHDRAVKAQRLPDRPGLDPGRHRDEDKTVGP